MSQPIAITSTMHLQRLMKDNTYVVVDFHATWCGPCHAIAPVYSQLSTQNASTGDLAFAKVDVDEQQQLARQYNVTAMPTFLIFKNGTLTDTIQGANPPALKRAVEAASAAVRAEHARRAQEAKEAEKAEKAEKSAETTSQPNDVSVSGSYGISQGSGWKMSLR